MSINLTENSKLTIVDVAETPGIPEHLTKTEQVPIQPSDERKFPPGTDLTKPVQPVRASPDTIRKQVPKKFKRGVPSILRVGQFYSIRSLGGREDLQRVAEITMDISNRDFPRTNFRMESIYYPGITETITNEEIYRNVSGYAEPEAVSQ
jgi:hypothetical protein